MAQSLLTAVQKEVLARLAGVGVTARQAVDSLLTGQHRSIHRGLSVEFTGHRPYQTGDDLRHLDWQVYARTDRYDVRCFEEETYLRATIVVDASGSMAYEHRHGSKFDAAKQLAAALAFLMVRQGDAVGLALCAERLLLHRPPLATMGHLIGLLGELEQSHCQGGTQIGKVLEELASRLHRRGLVIVITDGFEEPGPLLQALRFLRHRRQDVRVIQVLDPDEWRMDFRGTQRFVDLEGAAELTADSRRIRKQYKQALGRHQRQLEAGSRKAGVLWHRYLLHEDLATFLVYCLTQLPRHGQYGS